MQIVASIIYLFLTVCTDFSAILLHTVCMFSLSGSALAMAFITTEGRNECSNCTDDKSMKTLKDSMFVGVVALRCEVLITEGHNSHKHSQSPFTTN